MTSTGSILLWQDLSKRFSLIPLHGKRPFEGGWQIYCTEKREFKPEDFIGCNAGVACGPASKCLVLDIDHNQKFKQLRLSKGWDLPLDTYTVKTGANKFHLYFKYPSDGHRYANASFLDPQKEVGPDGKIITIFDIRGIGGQVVAPGSIHPDTRQMYVVYKEAPLLPPPQWLLDISLHDELDNPIYPTHRLGNGSWNGEIDSLPISDRTKDIILNGGNRGERSELIMAATNALVWSGLTNEQIVAIFDQYAIGEKYREKGKGKHRWIERHIAKARVRVTERYDWDRRELYGGRDGFEMEARAKASVTGVTDVTGVTSVTNVTSRNQNVTSGVTSGVTFSDSESQEITTNESPSNVCHLTIQPNKIELSQAQIIRDWIDTSDGIFRIQDMARELQIINTKSYSVLKKNLCELVRNKVLERVGNTRGVYRRIDRDLEEMDWWNTSCEPEFNVVLPLGIGELCRILPKNIIILAGERNSAKTALALSIAKLNMYYTDVAYFTSEMGKAELRNRLQCFTDVPLQEWRKVKFFDKASNFQDVILPNALNIIDYLEIHEEFYRVGGIIRSIYDALEDGIAVICLQKKPNCDTGKGGEVTLEKARLSMALSLHKDVNGRVFNRIKLVKVKAPRDAYDHPEGMMKDFNVFAGAEIKDRTEWYREGGNA